MSDTQIPPFKRPRLSDWQGPQPPQEPQPRLEPQNPAETERFFRGIIERANAMSKQMDLKFYQARAAEQTLEGTRQQQRDVFQEKATREEMGLLEANLSSIPLDRPENVTMFSDWFAELKGRMGANVDPKLVEMEQQFKMFTELPKALTMDLDDIRGKLKTFAEERRGGFQEHFDRVGRGFESGVTMGLSERGGKDPFPVNVLDQFKQEIEKGIAEAVIDPMNRRFPQEMDPNDYYRLLQSKVLDMLPQMLEEFGGEPSLLEKSGQPFGEMLGFMVGPMKIAGAGGKAASAAFRGAGSLSKVGRGLTSTLGAATTLGAMQYAVGPNDQEVNRIKENEPDPEKQEALIESLRRSNAMFTAALWPIFTVAGKAGQIVGQVTGRGGQAGGMVASQWLGGGAEAMSKGGAKFGQFMGQSMGTGFMFPAVSEIGTSLIGASYSKMFGASEEQQRLMELNLMTTPGLHGVTGKLFTAITSQDGERIIQALKDYAGHAAPDMAAFVVLNGAHLLKPYLSQAQLNSVHKELSRRAAKEFNDVRATELGIKKSPKRKGQKLKGGEEIAEAVKDYGKWLPEMLREEQRAFEQRAQEEMTTPEAIVRGKTARKLEREVGGKMEAERQQFEDYDLRGERPLEGIREERIVTLTPAEFEPTIGATKPAPQHPEGPIEQAGGGQRRVSLEKAPPKGRKITGEEIEAGEVSPKAWVDKVLRFRTEATEPTAEELAVKDYEGVKGRLKEMDRALESEGVPAGEARRDVIHAWRQFFRFREIERERQDEGLPRGDQSERSVVIEANARAEAWRDYAQRKAEWLKEGKKGKEPVEPALEDIKHFEKSYAERMLSGEIRQELESTERMDRLTVASKARRTRVREQEKQKAKEEVAAAEQRKVVTTIEAEGPEAEAIKTKLEANLRKVEQEREAASLRTVSERGSIGFPEEARKDLGREARRWSAHRVEAETMARDKGFQDPQGRNFGKTVSDMAVELKAMPKDAGKLQRWLDLHEQVLEGPAREATEFYTPGKRLLKQIEKRKGEAGFIFTALPSGTAHLESVRKAARWIATKHRKTRTGDWQVEMRTGDPQHKNPWFRELRKWVFSPTTYGGFVATEAQRAEAMMQHEPALLHKNWLHGRNAILKEVKAGSEMDRNIFNLQRNEALRHTWARKAEGGDTVAARELELARKVQKFYADYREIIKQIHPTATGHREKISEHQQNIRDLGKLVRQIEKRKEREGIEPEALEKIDKEITATRKFIAKESERLAKENDRLEKFLDQWGQENYAPNIMDPAKWDHNVHKDYDGLWLSSEVTEKGTVVTKTAEGAKKAARLKEKKGTLEEKGLVHESVIATMDQYIRTMPVWVRVQEYFNHISKRYNGERRLARFAERYDKKTGEKHEVNEVFRPDPARTYHWNGRKWKSFGRVGKKIMLVSPAWEGAPKSRQAAARLLTKPKKELKALEDGNSIALVSPWLAARTLRVQSGGVREKLDRIARNDVDGITEDIAKISREIRTGKISDYIVADYMRKGGRVVAKTLSSMMSFKLLGGPINFHNAANAYMGGTFVNGILFGAESFAAMRHFPSFNLAFKKALKGWDPGMKTAKPGGYQDLIAGISEAVGKAADKHLKSLPKEEAAIIKEGWIAFARSHMTHSSRADRMTDLNSLGRPGRKVPRGGLTDLRATWGKVEDFWYMPFNFNEAAVRYQPFMHVYVRARKAGKSDQEAWTEAWAGTHAGQLVYGQLAKSGLMRTPLGTVMGNMMTWVTHWTGREREMAAPLTKFILTGGLSGKKDVLRSTAAVGRHLTYLTGTAVAAYTLLGQDLHDVLTSRVEDTPFIGEDLRNLLLGFGTKTKADKLGLKPKGPFWNMGLPSIPSIFVMPGGSGSPAYKVLKEATLYARELFLNGNPEKASEHLARFFEMGNPLTLTWTNQGKQIQRAWGLEPDPDNPGMYIRRSPTTGKVVGRVDRQGFLQWVYLQIPGGSVGEREQYILADISRTSTRARKAKGREMTLKGERLIEAQTQARESGSAVDAQVFHEEHAGLKQFSEDLKRPIGKGDVKRWRKNVGRKAWADPRTMAIFRAGTKSDKLYEFKELLADKDYVMSVAYARRITKDLGGSKGWRKWIADSDLPRELVRQFREAERARKAQWRKKQ